MKNLCLSVTCADQGHVCYVNSKESLCFHAQKPQKNQKTKTKNPNQNKQTNKAPQNPGNKQ